MIALFAAIALANPQVKTFEADRQYTAAPFAGLERLYVDPATTVGLVAALPAAPAGEHVLDAPGHGQLVFTNPMSNWGEVTVGGVKIGTIGPYATMTLDGFAPGFYAVDVGVSTGLTRHFAVEVAKP